MVRLIGYLMFVCSALAAVLAWRLGWTMMQLAEIGVVRPGAKLELLLVIFCGVVLPLGIGAIILKKSPAP